MKPSEIFEGENSSLHKTFKGATLQSMRERFENNLPIIKTVCETIILLYINQLLKDGRISEEDIGFSSLTCFVQDIEGLSFPIEQNKQDDNKARENYEAMVLLYLAQLEKSGRLTKGLGYPSIVCFIQDVKRLSIPFKSDKDFIDQEISLALAQERKVIIETLTKQRERFQISTEFAVKAINEIGESGKMARELRDLGRYQAIDDIITNLSKSE